MLNVGPLPFFVVFILLIIGGSKWDVWDARRGQETPYPWVLLSIAWVILSSYLGLSSYQLFQLENYTAVVWVGICFAISIIGVLCYTYRVIRVSVQNRDAP